MNNLIILIDIVLEFIKLLVTIAIFSIAIPVMAIIVPFIALVMAVYRSVKKSDKAEVYLS